MNRIEATQHAWIQRGGGVEQVVIDGDEIEPLEKASSAGERSRPVASHGTKHLHPCQAARGALGLVPEEAPQGGRLRLGNDELHQRGRIEVDQGVLSLP